MKSKIKVIFKSILLSSCLLLAFMFFVNRLENLVLIKNPNTPNYNVSKKNKKIYTLQKENLLYKIHSRIFIGGFLLCLKRKNL